MVRAPVWFILLLLLAAIGVGVYAYYTTPLPYGLSSIVRTPGGEIAPTPVPTTVGARTSAGQGLVLGATTISVQAIQRNQELASGNRGGPPGSFTVLDLLVRNSGTEPLTPKPEDFRLMDDVGRTYAVDPEATRSVNSTGHRRVLFDASVPPSGAVATLLAFETPPDVAGLTLRVTLGYGDLELPR